MRRDGGFRPKTPALNTAEEPNMNSNVTRRITTALAGVIAAAGIFAGSLVLGATEAGAQPTTGTQCSSMSMPAGQADAAAANPLTRAGQIGAAGNAPASSGSGAMDCQAVGHG
jgi:hypothetical protein